MGKGRILLIALGVCVATILVVYPWNSSASNTRAGSTSVPTPPPAFEIEEMKRLHDRNERMRTELRKVGGDFNKLSPEAQKGFNETSMGHGKEFAAQMWKQIKEEEGRKATGTPKAAK
jgi:hypothetical protein